MADSPQDKRVPSPSTPKENPGNSVFGQATVAPSPNQGTPPLRLDQFADRLVESGLISAPDLQAVQGRLQPLTLDSLIDALVASKKFSRFQINNIVAGNIQTLFIGEYLLLDEIGAGGMGQVFRALHRTMKRVVALKVLPPQAAPSKDAVQRFLREVQAIAKLSHPNIVAAYDAGEQGGRPYLAMEYIQGTDLHRYVQQKGRLPLAEALDLVLQTARGLSVAHSAGVVHRDIKPLNLLRNPEGVVKILDLGLAKVKGDATVTAAGVAMGTPDYLSPEQGMNAAAVDHRTDIYSLGCTLYFLLTGKAVYQGDSFVKIIMAHQQSPIPSLREARPDVPEKLDAVFQKMVTKKPADRHQSMSEVITSLSALKNGAESKPRRRKSGWVAALLIVSLLATAGVFSFVGLPQGLLPPSERGGGRTRRTRSRLPALRTAHRFTRRLNGSWPRPKSSSRRP